MFEPICEEDYNSKTPEWYYKNQKPPVYLWAQHFSLPEKKRNPIYVNLFRQEHGLMKLLYPFLEDSQIFGKTLAKFGIPNICGEVSKQFLREYGKQSKKKPKTQANFKTKYMGLFVNKLNTHYKVTPSRRTELLQEALDSSMCFNEMDESDSPGFTQFISTGRKRQVTKVENATRLNRITKKALFDQSSDSVSAEDNSRNVIQPCFNADVKNIQDDIVPERKKGNAETNKEISNERRKEDSIENHRVLINMPDTSSSWRSIVDDWEIKPQESSVLESTPKDSNKRTLEEEISDLKLSSTRSNKETDPLEQNYEESATENNSKTSSTLATQGDLSSMKSTGNEDTLYEDVNNSVNKIDSPIQNHFEDSHDSSILLESRLVDRRDSSEELSVISENEVEMGECALDTEKTPERKIVEQGNEHVVESSRDITSDRTESSFLSEYQHFLKLQSGTDGNEETKNDNQEMVHPTCELEKTKNTNAEGKPNDTETTLTEVDNEPKSCDKLANSVTGSNEMVLCKRSFSKSVTFSDPLTHIIGVDKINKIWEEIDWNRDSRKSCRGNQETGKKTKSSLKPSKPTSLCKRKLLDVENSPVLSSAESKDVKVKKPKRTKRTSVVLEVENSSVLSGAESKDVKVKKPKRTKRTSVVLDVENSSILSGAESKDVKVKKPKKTKRSSVVKHNSAEMKSPPSPEAKKEDKQKSIEPSEEITSAKEYSNSEIHKETQENIKDLSVADVEIDSQEADTEILSPVFGISTLEGISPAKECTNFEICTETQKHTKDLSVANVEIDSQEADTDILSPDLGISTPVHISDILSPYETFIEDACISSDKVPQTEDLEEKNSSFTLFIGSDNAQEQKEEKNVEAELERSHQVNQELNNNDPEFVSLETGASSDSEINAEVDKIILDTFQNNENYERKGESYNQDETASTADFDKDLSSDSIVENSQPDVNETSLFVIGRKNVTRGKVSQEFSNKCDSKEESVSIIQKNPFPEEDSQMSQDIFADEFNSDKINMMVSKEDNVPEQCSKELETLQELDEFISKALNMDEEVSSPDSSDLEDLSNGEHVSEDLTGLETQVSSNKTVSSTLDNQEKWCEDVMKKIIVSESVEPSTSKDQTKDVINKTAKYESKDSNKNEQTKDVNKTAKYEPTDSNKNAQRSKKMSATRCIQLTMPADTKAKMKRKMNRRFGCITFHPDRKSEKNEEESSDMWSDTSSSKDYEESFRKLKKIPTKKSMYKPKRKFTNVESNRNKQGKKFRFPKEVASPSSNSESSSVFSEQQQICNADSDMDSISNYSTASEFTGKQNNPTQDSNAQKGKDSKESTLDEDSPALSKALCEKWLSKGQMKKYFDSGDSTEKNKENYRNKDNKTKITSRNVPTDNSSDTDYQLKSPLQRNRWTDDESNKGDPDFEKLMSNLGKVETIVTNDPWRKYMDNEGETPRGSGQSSSTLLEGYFTPDTVQDPEAMETSASPVDSNTADCLSSPLNKWDDENN